MQKCQANFVVAYFCNFQLFYFLLPFWQKITWKFVFISNMHNWKNILVHLKKFSHLGNRSYCFWNTVFVENYISWCLIYRMAIWIKFVNKALKVGFQNIYFLSSDLLGINAYSNMKMPENWIFLILRYNL